MKTKTLFGFVVAAIIALFAVSSVIALPVTFNEVTVNDVDLAYGSLTQISGSPGETVPIVVRFTANDDIKDIKVKANIGDGDSVSTSRFDVLSGKTYVKRFSITLPSVQDMDDVNETWTLRVILSDRTGDEKDSTYLIGMQRDSYSLNFLFVDAPMKASAGDIIALDVVLKNTGSRTADDNFVSVSIPELGLSKRAYFGDLVAVDNENSNDNEDARERRIYLVIPSDAKSGDYELNVRASNYDANSVVKKAISITGSATSGNNSTAINPTSSGKSTMPTSVIVLTVVLVIIFVVLLVVLIVLLTKKPAEKSEDFGETSYY
jgi:hypothetical protein